MPAIARPRRVAMDATVFRVMTREGASIPIRRRPVAQVRRKSVPGRLARVAIVAAIVMSADLGLSEPAQTTPFVPVPDPDEPAYLGSAACITCHPEAGQRWQNSHHAWAWRKPSPNSVLGAFDGRRLLHDGVIVELTRRPSRSRSSAKPRQAPHHEPENAPANPGEYVIRFDPDSDSPTEYPIVGTVGVAPLQQFLVETEPGRFQALDLAWDVERGRWYDLYPGDLLPVDDGMHWSGPYKNFNARCAECHATGYEKRYQPRERRYQSRQAEIGVGCEACHGPGEAHRDWAKAPARFDSGLWNEVDPNGLTLGFSAGAPEDEIQQCAACHARRESLGDPSPRPGSAFHDAYRLSTLREGLYYPDGQIQGEVYVYGSFLQSAMYRKGVRCSNCHDPHSGSLRQAGNAICTQCHNETGRPEFPSLPRALFDSSKHHFHAPNSTGAQCVSCHMPEQVYMGIDGRRDHGFRVPRPDLSERLGAPDVCTSCHVDRSVDWAAAEIARRYPDGRHKRRHWGEVLAAARRRLDRDAQQALLALARDPESPAIVRASALAHLRPVAGPELAAAIVSLLSDPEPLVRAEAAELQTAAPPEERAKRLALLLSDPQRSVRLAAIRGLLVPAAARAVAPPARDAWQSAMRELQDSLYARADFPEVQLMIAGIAMQSASVSAAEAAFGEALRMDRQFEDAWIGLSRLKILVGNLDGARVSLKEGIAAAPQSVTLRFQLGQLELEAGDLATAVRVLELAHQLDPDYPHLLATLEIARGMVRDRDQ